MKPRYPGLPSVLTVITVAMALPASIDATTSGGQSARTHDVRWVFPNPFKQGTKFELRMPRPGKVTIDIYNIRGQHIRNLAEDEEYQAGEFFIDWDGRDKFGKEVVPGVYICTLVADGNPVKSVKAIKM